MISVKRKRGNYKKETIEKGVKRKKEAADIVWHVSLIK
jgi:hypothetical protein